MFRLCALLLAILLPLAAQNDPVLLQIHIVEGEGLAYAVGSRATKGVTVQVTDETGKAVDGASVAFRLPDTGPTGTFSTGARMQIVTTASDGRAAAWGMQWNGPAGPLDLRITAAKGPIRAGSVCSLYLIAAAPAAEHSLIGGHKKLWLLLGAIGAAGAGVAVAASRGSATAATTPATVVPVISAPTISIGK